LTSNADSVPDPVSADEGASDGRSAGLAAPRALLEPILELHATIRQQVIDAFERESVESMSRVAHDEADGGDTIYAIDRVSESLLVEVFESLASRTPLLLIAEGVEGGSLMLPRGADVSHAAYRVIVDPIDGTRGLMYQKRPGWILTGVAPNRGPDTSLKDVALAVQTELPLVKQHLADQLWCERGGPVAARRWNRLTGETASLQLSASRETTLAHGYATVARFFPGGRETLAAVDDAVVSRLLGDPTPGKAACFEDQYACTGGQLYELLAGRDRFIADLRPLTRRAHGAGPTSGLCCHPYDLATASIAEAGGVVLRTPDGQPLDAPLDVDADVAWVGYANESLRASVEPVLIDELRRRGLLS